MIPFEAPLPAFASWFEEARASEADVPDAMSLATIGPDGRPSLRMVLMKGVEPDAIVFYTNMGSRKARHLRERPVAAACFHWKSLQRQVIFEGAVEEVDAKTVDAYFATRPRGSQLGAWASRQSEVLDARERLEQRLANRENRFRDRPVPRPPFWTGFRIRPDRVEFWQGRPDRLHDRVEFVRDGGAWAKRNLFP